MVYEQNGVRRGCRTFMLSGKSMSITTFLPVLSYWQITFPFLAFWSSDCAPLCDCVMGSPICVPAVVYLWCHNPWFGLTLHCFFISQDIRKYLGFFLFNAYFGLSKWILLSFSTPRQTLDKMRKTVTVCHKVNVLFDVLRLKSRTSSQ